MSRKFRVLGLLVGAFAMLALVACSSSDDDGGDATSTATETATSTAATTATGEATSTADASATADAGEAGEVAVTLGQPSELALETDVPSVAAGSVTFDVTNGGALPHEFVIVKSDLAPEALPTADGAVDESAVEVVDKVMDVQPGANDTVTADLESGSYVLLCNVIGHYAGGMHLAFTVE